VQSVSRQRKGVGVRAQGAYIWKCPSESKWLSAMWGVPIAERGQYRFDLVFEETLVGRLAHRQHRVPNYSLTTQAEQPRLLIVLAANTLRVINRKCSVDCVKVCPSERWSSALCCMSQRSAIQAAIHQSRQLSLSLWCPATGRECRGRFFLAYNWITSTLARQLSLTSKGSCLASAPAYSLSCVDQSIALGKKLQRDNGILW